MKHLIMLPFLALSIITCAQSDIDVVLLKNGTRLECEIQKIENDSIIITQFSGHHQVVRKYALDEIAIYLINNFYTTPGEELRKASRNLKFGAGIVLVGGTLSYLAKKDDRENLNDIGMGLAAVGTIICILGFDNFKKAGKKIDRIDFGGDRLIFKL